MSGNTDKDLSLNKSIKMWKNIPIDSRQVTPSLNELDENITYPYIGMIFYSEFEDDYYKVLSLEDGYRVGRTGQIVRASQVDNPDENNKIPGYFIGGYEQYILKGNTATMVKTAYIDQAGFLHIVFADNSDHNVGYIIGESGFSPTITAIKENGVTTITTTNLVDGKEVQSEVKILDSKEVTVDTALDSTSMNPVANSVIYQEIGNVQAILATLTTP